MTYYYYYYYHFGVSLRLTFIPFPPTGASQGDTSLTETDPNAERANGDSISQELERLAA